MFNFRIKLEENFTSFWVNGSKHIDLQLPEKFFVCRSQTVSQTIVLASHIIWWGKLSGGRHEKNISLFRSAMWKLHITKLLAVYFSLEFRHSIETEMKLSGEYLPVFIQYKNRSSYFNRSTDTKLLYLSLEWSYTPSNWFNETFLCTQKSFGSGTFSGWLNC